jgi:uncharacterized damage-inducible protein DinB
MVDPLIDAWRIGGTVVQFVLAAIAPESLGDRGASKGRSVGEMIAHIHNVRLMWLQSAAPALLAGLAKIEKDAAGDKIGLDTALTASAAAIAAMLEGAIAAGRVKGFKPHPSAFVGYLIAHESYHLGEIGVALQQSGHALDKKTAFGMWEWGARSV